MTELPPSSRYLQQASEVVDDTEREALTKRISDAFADGRMTQDDYMAALDVIYSAQHLGELVPVIERLPAVAVDVPNLVETSGTTPGELTKSRNVLVPAIVITGVILALLMVLGVLAFVLLIPG